MLELSPNTKLSHYRIVEKLGAGGMGEVYLAEDSRLRRKVALKVLPENIAAELDRLRRFEREAHATSALNHPNILTIFEFGAAGDTHFLASEYVKGETLRDRLRRDPFTLSETLDITIQIASALQAAHEAGIVHRDVKPENVMIREDGYVKVLDFGLAKLVERTSLDAEAETRMQVQTQAGMIMGTVAYMSPEQARGKAVDARTDIFSLGVVLYEMLTGKQPFTGETINHTIVAILEKEPPPLSQFINGFPAEVERIIKKCLAKRTGERYNAAKDLLADLRTLQKRLEFETELERTSSPNRNPEAQTQIIRAKVTAETEALNSIAVLPFANMSNDAENEYFCDGLAEELLNALAKIEDLKVAARSSAFSFKGKNTNVSEIGDVLNVRTVLQGSVRKSGNRVRITVQLVNAADGYHLWSERYDREMRDIFDVQDEIALSVVDALKVKLFGEEKAEVLKRYTNNPEAYQLYLKGRYHWTKQTPENIRKSRVYFEQAIDLDPAYAPGYTGLGGFYGFSAALGWMLPEEGWQKAEALMTKAQELDDTLPEVHTGLAAIRMFYYRDPEGMECEVKRAIELNPNYAEIHNFYAYCLVAMRRFDDAIAAGRRALELDPLSLTYHHHLGNWFYYAQQYDEAIGKYHDTLELDANRAPVYEELGDAYEQKGMTDEAIAAWRQAMTLAGDDELATILDESYAKSDFCGAVQAVARKRLEQLNERRKRGEYVPAIEYAHLYTRLGDKEQAFQWLEKACEERSLFPLYISVDPIYDSLRSDSRYRDILRCVGLQTEDTAQGESTNEPGEARTVLLSPATTDANKNPIADTNAANEQTPERLPKTKRNWLKRNWLKSLLPGLLLVAALGSGLWFYGSRSVRQIESIAVMPFVNASGNVDNEYLSDGMTETLIGSLSQLPKLNVKARSSVFRYKGKEVDLQKVAQELNVQAILTGRVVQRGQDLTLYIELVDANTENVLWKENYNRSMTNLATLQSEIARDVSGKLRTKLSGAERNQIVKNYTENTEAYRLYLQGRFFWNKRTPEDFRKAAEFFKQAIALDADFALAYSGLADCYTLLPVYDAKTKPQEVMLQAKEAATKALALDDNLAEAHASLGLIYDVYEWNSAEAIKHYRRAVELNPNFANAHRWLGERLIANGRFDEALPELRRAVELDPFSPLVNSSLGSGLNYARRYDEAITQLNKALELDPSFMPVYDGLFQAYANRGMQAEAAAAFLKRKLLAGDAGEIAAAKEVFAKNGWQAFVRREAAYLEKNPQAAPDDIAQLYAHLGKKEQTLKWLEKAYEERRESTTWLKVNPTYDFLRDDPRFEELLRKSGFSE